MHFIQGSKSQLKQDSHMITIREKRIYIEIAGALNSPVLLYLQEDPEQDHTILAYTKTTDFLNTYS